MGKASAAPTRENWMSSASTRMNPWPEDLGCENCTQLNHDLFSFTKAMKEGWQMNGRWMEGGLVIELFKTTRACMKFDRMIPSGSSWLMGIKVQRVLDHAHSAMEPAKTISMQNFTKSSLDTQMNTY